MTAYEGCLTSNKGFNLVLSRTHLLKSYIGIDGLPIRPIMLARCKSMVLWNSETGEVSTVKYNSGTEIKQIWIDHDRE